MLSALPRAGSAPHPTALNPPLGGRFAAPPRRPTSFRPRRCSGPCRAALASRDQALAEKVLDQVLASNPDLTEAILARAELNIRSDHAAQAVGPLEDLLKKQPRLQQAQVLLSSA